MAPSIESLNQIESLMMEPSSHNSIQYKTIAMDPPTKTVAFAVNYELAMVDQFLCAERRTRVIRVETPTSPTARDLCVLSGIKPSLSSSQGEVTDEDTTFHTSTTDWSKQSQKRLHDNPNDLNDTSLVTHECDESSLKRPSNSVDVPTTPTTVLALSPECSVRRVSTREKHKREAPLARNRIRYDMQLVPPVRRNRLFLDAFHKWWLDTSRTQELNEMSHYKSRVECMPFEEDSSVLWIPSKRSEWEDSISEMTAVCTCAAIQRLRRADVDSPVPSTHKMDTVVINADNTVAPLVPRPFLPPLSSNYIRDRIDIDDPLKGYQIRHKYGGWLQGFIIYTHFTTWTYGFHWDSQHSLCGLPSDAKSVEHQKLQSRQVDDGTLARELEMLPRSGDPGAGGIVFPAIAEISLLGGLGCGQYLLRMVLDDIRATRHYKYVALEAAEQAVPFYERFGFVRVGAICQYGKPGLDNAAPSSQHPAEPSIVGYRHWTHSNESERSLKLRGPSYMMCLKLPELGSASTLEADGILPSFVRQMHSLQVASKPRVEHLGASATPGPKISARRSNSMPINISAYHDTSGNSSPRENGLIKRGRLSKRKSMVVSPTPPLSIVAPLVEPVTIPLEPIAEVHLAATRAVNIKVKPARVAKRVFSIDTTKSIKRKRPASIDTCSTTLPAGRPLTFVEKQYHSVWLAVPPKNPPALSISRSTQKTRASMNHKDETKAEKKAAKRAQTSIKTCPGFARLKVALSKPKSSQKEIKPKSPSKLKSKSKVTFSTADSGRIYHSIRGIDGKFMRVYEDDPAPIKTTNPVVKPLTIKQESSKRHSVTLEPKSKKRRLNSSESTDSRSVLSALLHVGNSVPFDKKTLRKQKVKSYPRNHVHFFNRVVKPKRTAHEDNLYFVAEYDDGNGMLRLIPMVASGTLLGQREGRPRYQCVIGDTDENFKTVSTADYEVVRSAVVMKTPFIASEAWDVETDEDSNFQTR